MSSLAEMIQQKKLLAEQKKQSILVGGNEAKPIPRVITSLIQEPIQLPVAIPAIEAPIPIIKLSLKDRLIAIHNKNQNSSNSSELEAPPPLILVDIKDSNIPQGEYKGAFSLDISLNKEQLLAKEMAFAGKSFCLIGAAGTGKTTAQREIASELLRQNLLGVHTFRVQGSGERVNAPSIAFVAYTRIASGNLKRAIHKDPLLASVLEHNVTTIHNLLEYQPETYWNYETNKEAFRFIPRRNSSNPLDITHLIIEESSMVGLDLWEKLYDALRSNVQIIYIGDINQLPPVFGSSILNYALVQLPVVELTQVYRQKEGSSVLDNAHNILSGKPLEESKDFKIVRAGDTQLSQTKLALMLGKTFPKWAEAGEYNPDEDIILSPWNKHELGTDNMNKWIAQHLGANRGAIVYEVLAGITKCYLAVGDKVMFQKQIGYIKTISNNAMYAGRRAQPAGTNLTRFGVRIGTDTSDSLDDDDSFEFAGYEDINLDSMMDSSTDEIKRQTSHIVDIELETGEIVTLSTVGDFSPSVFSLGYVLTVHKAQGCEWRKVFLILHKDHAISAFRELLYTAVTRAREQVILISKDFMLQKAIDNPRIKGNSIAEKIEYFNGGAMNLGVIRTTK